MDKETIKLNKIHEQRDGICSEYIKQEEGFIRSKNRFKTFSLQSNSPITEDEAKQYQLKHGYPSAGYGFFGFNQSLQTNDKYIAIWACWMDCD